MNFSHIHVASTSRADYRGLKVVASSLMQAYPVSFGVYKGQDGDFEHARRLYQARDDGLPVVEVSLAPQPDLLVVLGDRIELLSNVIAAVKGNYPIAHFHGGEETRGAIDDQIRHAITKLSHLHFVSHEKYAERVLSLGEETWRVYNVGAPSLDDLGQPSVDKGTMQESLGFNGPYLTVCYHPETRELGLLDEHISHLEGALSEINMSVFWLSPGTDPGYVQIVDRALRYSEKSRHLTVFSNSVAPQDYVNILANSECLVGNSSAGIYEAPSWGLPVVNIGSRQEGRVRGNNVIDVPPERDAIIAGIRKVLSGELRQKVINPFYQGGTGQQVLQVLQTLPDDTDLLSKKVVLR